MRRSYSRRSLLFVAAAGTALTVTNCAFPGSTPHGPVLVATFNDPEKPGEEPSSSRLRDFARALNADRDHRVVQPVNFPLVRGTAGVDIVATITQASSAGSRRQADVVVQVPDAQSVRELARAGLLEPVEARIASYASLQPSAYWPGTMATVTVGAHIYGLPLAVHPLMVVYDMRLIQQAGLPPPADGWTWEQFVSTAASLTRRVGTRVVQWGFEASSPHLLPLLASQRDSTISGQPGGEWLKLPASTDACRFVQSLATEHQIVRVPAPTLPISSPAYTARGMTLADGTPVAMTLTPNPENAIASLPAPSPLQAVRPPGGTRNITLAIDGDVLALLSGSRGALGTTGILVSLARDAPRGRLVSALKDGASHVDPMLTHLATTDTDAMVVAMPYAEPAPLLTSRQRTILLEQLQKPILSGQSLDVAIAQTVRALAQSG